MRDSRFIAAHRGGTLGLEQHRQLIRWACACVAHVLPLAGESVDNRLRTALAVANAWERGAASVGEGRKASLAAIAAARASKNPVSVAIARAAGHAVATAHMADHALIAADYALKAVKHAGNSARAELAWQQEQLSAEIYELVVSYRRSRRGITGQMSTTESGSGL
jgi:hypothetical protein